MKKMLFDSKARQFVNRSQSCNIRQTNADEFIGTQCANVDDDDEQVTHTHNMCQMLIDTNYLDKEKKKKRKT